MILRANVIRRLFCAAALLSPAACFAHPMGNFSINHYSRLLVDGQWVEVTYLIDRAEIPTYQEIREFQFEPRNGDSTVQSYLRAEVTRLREGLKLDCDGQALALAVFSEKAVFTPGAGDLPTMKISVVLRSKLPGVGGDHTLHYSDNNFPGRAGWKELIVLSGEGARLRQSSAPEKDRSGGLTAYSSDLLNSPPQQLTAEVAFTAVASTRHFVSRTPAAHRQEIPTVSSLPIRPSPAPAEARTNSLKTSTLPRHTVASNTPRSRFTQLIASREKLGFWLLLTAAFFSAGLGALHALEPGHGKTLVAAYLVGTRGTATHAVLLGLIVTLAHTAGVFALGVVTLYASRYVVPEQLYPWLGALSGLSVIAMACFIFLQRWTGNMGDHSHSPADNHSHWFFSMFRRQRNVGEPSTSATSVSLRQLLALGVTGGIVPCPAALVVLLSAFSLHRIGFGLFLITTFSAGLAAVLVAIGLIMVYAKRYMALFVGRESSFTKYLPLISSACMVIIGVGITYSALAALPFSHTAVPKGSIASFVSIILLGLFLGMRHSTDSDHVVAVTTLVSRQGSFRSSAMIGMLWGLGHTITIFFVGCAIIVFGFVIPPRLGLSMEFAVALMLILLGVLNLTGKLRRLTARLSPPELSQNPAVACVNAQQKLGVYHTLRPLLVGLVHGLAGSAAVALLVLSTIRSPFWASAYLVVFGAGTMAGMTLMTSAISLPLVYAKNRFRKLTSRLTFFSGIASMAFGLFLAFQIGFVDGLFSTHVHWVAH